MFWWDVTSRLYYDCFPERSEKFARMLRGDCILIQPGTSRIYQNYENETEIVLYFRIEAMNYDGSCRKELIMLPYQVYGLTFHENMLYFSYWDEPSVQVYDIMRKETRIVANYTDRTFGVTVYKPKDMCKLSFYKNKFP